MEKIELSEEQLTDLKTKWVCKELDTVLGIQLAVGLIAAIACSVFDTSRVTAIWLVTIVNIMAILLRSSAQR